MYPNKWLFVGIPYFQTNLAIFSTMATPCPF